MRFLLPALTLTVCALVTGCDQDRFLSGKWFTAELEDAEAEALGAQLGCPSQGSEPCRVWIELAMGQFGADVVGVIRFYEDERRAVEHPCTACPTQRLQGRYSAETFTFAFDDCQGNRVRAEFLGTGSPIAGTLTWPGGATVEIELVNTEDEDQITAQEKCPECVQGAGGSVEPCSPPS